MFFHLEIFNKQHLADYPWTEERNQQDKHEKGQGKLERKEEQNFNHETNIISMFQKKHFLWYILKRGNGQIMSH